MKNLAEIIAFLEENDFYTPAPFDQLRQVAKDIAVEYLSYDSKDIKANTCFICKGAKFKKEFLLDAISKGAVAYISEVDYHVDAIFIPVTGVRKMIPALANFFYNYPTRNLQLVGITGTKGKTSVTYFLKNILDAYVCSEQFKLSAKTPPAPKTAFLSSVDVCDGVEESPSTLTTPEALELYSILDRASKNNSIFVTMEVSSQALKMHRVDGLTYEVGAFLNIGNDHISQIEHPDFQDYFNSKLLLLKKCKNFVYNSELELPADQLDHKGLFSYSTVDPEADFYAYDIVHKVEGYSFKVNSLGVVQDFSINIDGIFNVSNATCAIAIAKLLGVDYESIARGLADTRISGRMEKISSKDGKLTVVVDYAHNALSFESLFTSLRSIYPESTLCAVFGSAGNKAVNRRKDMAEVTDHFADKAFLVPEDPAYEDPIEISAQIAQYLTIPYEIFDDRQKAVQECISQHDLTKTPLVIALLGKGRENYIKIGAESVECKSDYEIACEAVVGYDNLNS